MNRIKYPNARTFFLNQATKWGMDGFTVPQMATEMHNDGSVYPNLNQQQIQTRIATYAKKFCTEFDPRESILEPLKAKHYRLNFEHHTDIKSAK
ncbi:TPA: hypothetical protein I7730_15950 [Vibrio vulnificus]|uniref:Uncharacterized protein n=1 Tax=Vibrio vulnificus TaxID=672 RepID=A0A8H9N1V4_VIBVL|nr:hypothetical protein [Vibrio vulnificus]